MTARKLAINPLPWVLSPTGFDLSAGTLTVALEELSTVGYSAVHADIPEGMTPSAYLDFIGSFGFAPAPGYFSGVFDSRDAHAALVESARRHAANQAALGLTETFIANDLTPERMARPAVGLGSDPERLAVIAEGLAAAAEAGRAEGIRYALHPHVSSLIETEDEVRSVLDATHGSDLAFGPDTGHLTWAGSDLVPLIRDYADRIVALHVKDVDLAAASEAIVAGADYFAATMQNHVWTEPGRGGIDFGAVFAELPAEFAGWFVVEVDVPNLATPALSAAAARDFLLAHAYFAGAAA